MDKILKEVEAHQKKYQKETKELYGKEDAYKESEKKYTKYTEEQKQEIFSKGQKIFLDIANLIEKDPSEESVQILIGDWRNHITEYFYDCTTPILKGLGEMYVEDTRFKKNIDKVKPGLAEFLKSAIDIYCLNSN